MAVLEQEEIIQLIKAEEPGWIKEAKRKQKILNVHINGEGAAMYLNHLDDFENEKQYELRKKVVVSNKFVFANLMRPVDKVFTAKGGSKSYQISGGNVAVQAFKDHLKNVRYGKNLSKWIKDIQLNKYFSDPAGVVFFEWKDGKTWPTMKSIQRIRCYKTEGRDVDFILFEPETRQDTQGKEMKGQFFRLIDDAYDYTFWKDGDHVELYVPEDGKPEMYENPWGKVPAIVNSNIMNHQLKYADSPCDIVVELADKFLRSGSIKNIYEFLHGYPFFWMYARNCPSCKGSGEVDGSECKKCNGRGLYLKKDVSDVLFLNAPTKKDQPTLAPDVAGFVQPDLETWKELREELNWLFTAMYYTMWGAPQSIKSWADKATATEVSLEISAKNDRLGDFSDSLEEMEEKMSWFIGYFYFKEAYKWGSINYGRRYMMESPDVIWEKYLKAKQANAPITTLNHLLSQYYQSEFMNDMNMLSVMMKGMKLEPFIHNTTQELKDFITEEELKEKLYFGEWWASLDEDVILTATLKRLKDLFEKYLEEEKGVEIVDENDDSAEVKKATSRFGEFGVGGVQGILSIKEAVKNGTSDRESAIATLNIIYGFDRAKAEEILGADIKEKVTK